MNIAADPVLTRPKPVDVINQIARATSLQGVWKLLVQSMATYGFERVNYGYTNNQVGRSIGAAEDVLFLSTHALDAVIEHHASGRYLNAPEYRWVLENVGAVSWGWVQEMRATGQLSETEIRAIDALPAKRRRAGYSISFAETRSRAKGAIALAAAKGVDQDAVDSQWADYGNEIEAICNIAHFKIVQLPLPVPGAALKKRQLEVLEWIADGKTLADVCVLTNLSLSSVEKHLRHAREALSVETSAQAVGKLAFLNQLFVRGDPIGADDG